MPKSSANEFPTRLVSNGESFDIVVEIVDSARARKYCARIVGENRVKLVKPKWASRKEGLAFVESVADWIVGRLKSAPRRASLRSILENTPTLSVGGESWRVWLQTSRATSFFIEDPARKEIVFSCVDDAALLAEFKKFAAEKIGKLVREVSERIDIPYGKIEIRNQSGRWASRSSSGTLSFNWRVALLGAELQNYVVCHELAHVRFMDHSVSFWLWLNSFCPRAKHLDKLLTKEASRIFACDG